MAEEYFLGRSGSSRTGLVHIFDNLIQRGLCRPFIAVSPTWDKDNQSKGWGESTQEAAVFSQEYVNDLIPAVETRYSTYLESPDEAGILASRDHRAFSNSHRKAIRYHLLPQRHASPCDAEGGNIINGRKIITK